MFDLPTDLPADLGPLSWLIGVWEGTGVIDYEVGHHRFAGEFLHRVSFSHDGGTYLNYSANAWLLDDSPAGADGESARKPLVAEMGYWRLSREATDAELAVLARWIEFHKEHRALLLGGEIVRMDTPDPRIILHGVVAHDGSEAIYSAAVLDTPHPDPPARLKLRGLTADRAYRVTPVLIGTVPPGLIPPAWWGEPSDAATLAAQEYGDRAERADVRFPGGRFRGDVLAAVGVAAPRLYPDQAVLYRVVAED